MKRFSLLVALALPLVAGACRAQQPDPLAATIAELLPRVERLSGLQARDSIRFARRSRAQLRAFLEKELDRDLPPTELRGVRGVYRLLGLIPDTLDLRRLLLDVYTEQVVGFYEPRTKTLYVVAGATPGDFRPVVAHELVHALQDQYVDLDSLVSPSRGNDRQLAAQAALEGHATLVMFLLTLEDAGRPADPASLPDLAAEIRGAVRSRNAAFPVFRDAPEIVRESLLFPYWGGARFVQALWRRHPSAPPLDSLMPASSEQVSEPDGHFFRERDEPTRVRFAGAPAAGPWRVAYENTLGQEEIRVFLRRWLDDDAAAEGWDGDRFRLLENADERALLWYSVWDDAASADRFAAAYRRILRLRGRPGRVDRFERAGRALVRVVDAAADPDAAAIGLPEPDLGACCR